AAAQPQAKIMNKLAVYVFPLGVLVSGSFLPVAILIYWVSNNAWTVVQQHYVFKKIEREEDAKKERLEQVRADRAPKPGARPSQGKKGKAKQSSAVIDGDVVEDEPDTTDDDAAGTADSDASQRNGQKQAGGKQPQKQGNAKSSGSGKSGGGQARQGQKGQQNRKGGQGQKNRPQGQRPGG